MCEVECTRTGTRLRSVEGELNCPPEAFTDTICTSYNLTVPCHDSDEGEIVVITAQAQARLVLSELTPDVETHAFVFFSDNTSHEFVFTPASANYTTEYVDVPFPVDGGGPTGGIISVTGCTVVCHERCGCAFLAPAYSNNGGIFPNVATAQTSTDYVANCMVYYHPYDVHVLFGTSISVPSTFTAETDSFGDLGCSMIQSAAGANSQQVLVFSFTCDRAGTLYIDYNGSSNGGPTESFPERNSFLTLWRCDYKTSGQGIDEYSPALGVIADTGTLNVPAAGTYTVWVSFSPWPNATTSSLSFSTTLPGAIRIINPVGAEYDDSGTTRQLQACPMLIVGEAFSNQTEAQEFLDSEEISNCIGFHRTSVNGGEGLASSSFNLSGSTSVSITSSALTNFNPDPPTGPLLAQSILVGFSKTTSAPTSVTASFSFSHGSLLVVNIYSQDNLGGLTFVGSGGSGDPIIVPYAGVFLIIIGTLGDNFDSPSGEYAMLDFTASINISPLTIGVLYSNGTDCPSRLSCAP